MSDLHRLAAEAGLMRCWTDADGAGQEVSDGSLRAILTALDLPAGTPEEIARSRASLRHRLDRLPAMITADRNKPIPLPDRLHGAQLLDEAGHAVDIGMDSLRRSGVAEPGYYRLESAQGSIRIAIAPDRCPPIGRRCWGVAIQIPSLRGSGDFGDFGTLCEAVRLLGAKGADAVAISPVHALDDPARFAPYSPSSRLALNILFGEAEPIAAADASDLIDWSKAGPAKLAALRRTVGGDDAGLLQSHARRGLDAVQQAAREAGMAIGLIADLAVGVDPGGSDARSDPAAFLQGLRIGAPPDPLGPRGQDWGLTGYSPLALVERGFEPFIAMLRANMPARGGIRIDHGFGLQRLWVVPEGRAASEGAYLRYPFDDLLRLVKLEAWRARAIVIAEDLGTRPAGFSAALEAAGIHGMAVLPFSRDEAGEFLPAAAYPARSVAMSGTHDTPTLAGWWTGRDLEWSRLLDRGGESGAERDQNRKALWRAIGEATPMPAKDDPDMVIDRALAFLAGTPSSLLLVPMEDMVGMIEQPNLPGTVDTHPNWRRRLPDRMEKLLDRPDVSRRIDRLNRERGA
ncbi:4-alpha-glucanotransferase [Sphingobium fuliginis]|uniref:4-alpha-glucanotransferase n=1 Tax=Sphingobium fuliginis (strain ATCC 27551) TaxID=336203 RepID=A0A292ZN49_SPHSA|nr:4-alpha-glucanotransferase [Sphingobium fuliginis]GAY24300.1 4-alpha-glucanotransferase [Sphingobium fuliginis]